jgi:hypothetical protein
MGAPAVCGDLGVCQFGFGGESGVGFGKKRGVEMIEERRMRWCGGG